MSYKPAPSFWRNVFSFRSRADKVSWAVAFAAALGLTYATQREVQTLHTERELAREISREKQLIKAAKEGTGGGPDLS
ncbi:hypothetical protein ACKKBG_A23510 [Auxenochlorella protothecoides x Auxenochlorella symbiontica]|uniref:Uncharacterized protein n=1 Tax=Auxenochlorella protothecoides TaxID=3075 RepID=A0A3M7L3J4_AUXPR|nr:hypothetical protein APUTEX25_001432 [Auxenochlorella protothecoides]|eukprot:RMZ56585.1 hypothetical protein APUTEX25_001432 [Auxenochlorella protothecoides]